MPVLCENVFSFGCLWSIGVFLLEILSFTLTSWTKSIIILSDSDETCSNLHLKYCSLRCDESVGFIMKLPWVYCLSIVLLGPIVAVSGRSGWNEHVFFWVCFKSTHRRDLRSLSRNLEMKTYWRRVLWENHTFQVEVPLVWLLAAYLTNLNLVNIF